MKPTRQTCSTAYRDQYLGTRPPTAAACATTRGQRLLELSHTPPQILDSQLRSQSQAPPRRPCRPSIYLAWEYGGHTTLHAPPGFLASPPHAGENCTLLPHVDIATDVTWRHQMTSSLHVSSHASTSTSALVHIIRHVSNVASSAPHHLADRWPRPTRPGPPGSDPWALTVDFDPGSVDFDFLRWPLTKSQNFQKGLSYSVFREDSNFKLHFFI